MEISQILLLDNIHLKMCFSMSLSEKCGCAWHFFHGTKLHSSTTDKQTVGTVYDSVTGWYHFKPALLFPQNRLSKGMCRLNRLKMLPWHTTLLHHMNLLRSYDAWESSFSCYTTAQIDKSPTHMQICHGRNVGKIKCKTKANWEALLSCNWWLVCISALGAKYLYFSVINICMHLNICLYIHRYMHKFVYIYVQISIH